MAAPLVSDELWEVVEPLLPVLEPSPKGGPPFVPNRAALTGIIFVLRSGMAWNLLPVEMGCGSGVTCWRRLRDWTRAGVWPAVLAEMQRLYGRAGGMHAETAVVDSANVRAVFGGRTLGRTRRTVRKPAVRGMC